MQIKFKKLHPDAKLPLRGSAGAAGYDLYAIDYEIVGGLFLYSTGLAVELPDGHCGVIYPRSSGAFRSILMHGPTIIDSDYRGEIKILFDLKQRSPLEWTELVKWLDKNNKDSSLGHFWFTPGERIAQLVVQPFVPIEPVWAETLSETQRGAGGYGSTGA